MRTRRLGTALAGLGLILLLSACAGRGGAPTTPPPTSTTPPMTPTPTPPPTQTPTPTPTSGGDVPDTTVGGFDAEQLWSLCKAKGVATYPDITDYAPFSAATATLTDDGVKVSVPWSTTYKGTSVSSHWFCVFDGDPANPHLKVFDTPDR